MYVQSPVSIFYALALTTAMTALGFPSSALAQQDAEVQRLKDENAQLQQQIKELQLKAADQAVKQKDLELVVAAQKATSDRLLAEVKLLNKTIDDRERAIIALESAVKKLRAGPPIVNADAKALQLRNEALQEQLHELTRELARLQGKNLEDPSPPAVQINGKVEKVDGDLVQINLGTDNGLDKNLTFDVYRLKPERKYLGIVRIVDVNHKKSVGRFIRDSKVAADTKVDVGDQVTARLASKGEPNANDEPNPPPVKVNGKVMKVDGDKLTLDLGTDHGLKEGHTLELYRLAPKAHYLGMVRIEAVSNTQSIARIIPPRTSTLQVKIQEGDLVTSQLKK